jgi:hypothetical protein
MYMEYHILDVTLDAKVVGTAYPQTIFKNKKKLSPNPFLIANMTEGGEYLPENIPPFDYLELQHGAKLTDIMTSPFLDNGFLVSEKLKRVFEIVGVTDCKYYEVKLFKNSTEVKGYFYFHSARCYRDHVDFPKSSFIIESLAGVPIGPLPSVKSFEELKKIKTELGLMQTIRAKQFYLKSTFPFSTPLFKIFAYNYNFFITKTLKNALESHSITGTQILSAGDLIKTSNLS